VFRASDRPALDFATRPWPCLPGNGASGQNARGRTRSGLSPSSPAAGRSCGKRSGPCVSGVRRRQAGDQGLKRSGMDLIRRTARRSPDSDSPHGRPSSLQVIVARGTGGRDTGRRSGTGSGPFLFRFRSRADKGASRCRLRLSGRHVGGESVSGMNRLHGLSERPGRFLAGRAVQARVRKRSLSNSASATSV
jgi:hypothetical protein